MLSQTVLFGEQAEMGNSSFSWEVWCKVIIIYFLVLAATFSYSFFVQPLYYELNNN